MSDPHHDEPPHGEAFALNPETARIVLRLDHAICAFRAGHPSGLRALDSLSRLLDELADEQAAEQADERAGRRAGAPARAVPRRADHIELAILTALADTYGAKLLTHSPLGYAVRLIARHGGVAFVQRMLWGDSAADAQLSVMLSASRAAFTQIALAFPHAFLAEANAVIAACRSHPRPRPPGGPAPKKGGPHE